MIKPLSTSITSTWKDTDDMITEVKSRQNLHINRRISMMGKQIKSIPEADSNMFLDSSIGGHVEPLTRHTYSHIDQIAGRTRL